MTTRNAALNAQHQAAYRARARLIPSTPDAYRAALAKIYALGRAEAEAGLPVRMLEDMPFPSASHATR